MPVPVPSEAIHPVSRGQRSPIVAVCLFWCLILTLPGRADTPDDEQPRPGRTRVACPSELTGWDLEQARLLEATGIYDNPMPRREIAAYSVFLAFHVVRENDGTGGIDQSQLDQAMVDLAAAFDGSYICFQVAYQDTIDNSTYHDIDSSAERADLLGINNQPHMIDCYFVNYDDDACGVSSYSWSPVQGITFKNDCVGLPSNPSTVPHEVGHYFNLYHTHETGFGLECPDGDNCGSSGDLICDTPADPDVSGDVDSSCEYSGDAIIICDFEVQEYAPDCSNMMSYSDKTCRTSFTWDQTARMLTTLVVERWGEEGFTAPNFRQETPPGWTSGIVPRYSDGGTSGSCEVTPVLVGNANSTRLNISFTQESTESHNAAMGGTVYLDGEAVWPFSLPPSSTTGPRFRNDHGPIPVRGGRHTLHSVLDPLDEHCETNEGDNVLYTQYVWIPYPLSHGESILRDAPPGNAGTPLYPNCDGFGFTRSGWWSVIAVQPLSGSADYGLRLHNDYEGSTSGFAEYLAESTSGAGEPDWVIINHNVAPYGETWQAGVSNAGNDTADFRLNKAESHIEELEDGKRVDGVLAAHRILDIFEMHFLTADVGEEWTVTLTSNDAVDLDLYVYPADDGYMGRQDAAASSCTIGPGTETLVLDGTVLTTAGWYAVAVARHGMTDLGLAADWDVRFEVTSNTLAVAPQVAPQFLVVQDQDPYGSTEWTDQLAAQGVAYTVITTGELAGTVLEPYHAVILPSPMTPSSHLHVQANRDKLERYNDRGGIVIQGTSTAAVTGGFEAVGGLDVEWQPCTTAITADHLLVTGVADTTTASPAVRHVFPVLVPGWISLATSGCGDMSPCMVLDDDRGLLVYGNPLELSLSQSNGSLGESIENIVRWAKERAQKTIRLFGRPGDPPFTVTYNYSKDVFVACDYSHSGYPAWVGIDPVSDTIFMFDTSDPVVFTIDPAGLGIGSHVAMIDLDHELYGSPQAIRVHLNLFPRRPRPPMALVMTPMDFSPGHAVLHATWEPVTEDEDGAPITVTSYDVYIDDDPAMGSPVILSTATNSLSVPFHELGLAGMGFLRVTALDDGGEVVADRDGTIPLPVSVSTSDEPGSADKERREP